MRTTTTTQAGERRSRARVLRRHGVRAVTAGAALAASLLAVAGPAHAATGVSVSGGVLEVHAGAAADDIAVFVDTDGSLLVRNAGDTVTAGGPCVLVNANQADCPSAGVTTVAVTTGSGDDLVRNRTTLRSRVTLGPGADGFVGGLARDAVSGGDGDDRISGLGGDDLLLGDAGTDTATGGDGTDRCDAEFETTCES
ncbi:hypothetical protein MF672_027640 [Actinomadura sp. ATCC 31491]|uniref:Calcium-binding protein n=1 Tax=Actinomadura luzonensis TaxID=2805427 RepID=A0ABT0FYW2_9ACTN|nr:hypothetical protein [Actinomadura luzonensis]MCK2217536.1 hypothetical protein [Actinomadura luzonensis]